MPPLVYSWISLLILFVSVYKSIDSLFKRVFFFLTCVGDCRKFPTVYCGLLFALEPIQSTTTALIAHFGDQFGDQSRKPANPKAITPGEWWMGQSAGSWMELALPSLFPSRLGAEPLSGRQSSVSHARVCAGCLPWHSQGLGARAGLVFKTSLTSLPAAVLRSWPNPRTINGSLSFPRFRPNPICLSLQSKCLSPKPRSPRSCVVGRLR